MRTRKLFYRVKPVFLEVNSEYGFLCDLVAASLLDPNRATLVSNYTIDLNLQILTRRILYKSFPFLIGDCGFGNIETDFMPFFFVT